MVPTQVLGLYPGDAGDPGSDCAGVVVAAAGSSGVQPGDAVFGLATGSLGTHVQASALTLVPVPQHVGFEAAATMPTVGVCQRGRLRRQILGYTWGLCTCVGSGWLGCTQPRAEPYVDSRHLKIGNTHAAVSITASECYAIHILRPYHSQTPKPPGVHHCGRGA